MDGYTAAVSSDGCIRWWAPPPPPYFRVVAIDQCETSKGLDGVNETIVAYWSPPFSLFSISDGGLGTFPLVDYSFHTYTHTQRATSIVPFYSL